MTNKLQKQYTFSKEVIVERKGAPNQVFQKGLSYYLSASQVKEHEAVITVLENQGAPTTVESAD